MKLKKLMLATLGATLFSTNSSAIQYGFNMDTYHFKSFVSFRVTNSETHEEQPSCGGALIGDKWVVTAAHCATSLRVHKEHLYYVEKPMVRVGIDQEGNGDLIYPVEYWLLDGEHCVIGDEMNACDRGNNTKRHGGQDLMLVKLGESALRDSTEIVEMSRNTPYGTPVVQVGMGAIENINGGWLSKTLRGYTTTINHSDLCIPEHPAFEDFYDPEISYCQGIEGAIQRTGMADSGGPAYMVDPTTKKLVLAGLVSGGVPLEDGSEKAGLVRMIQPGSPKTLYWINKTIAESEKTENE